MGKVSKSLRGQLLLDGGGLAGSFFNHTVVLVCQHDATGAFGLVLNRAADNTVGDVITADLPDTIKAGTLYLGGPVQPSAFSYLHAPDDCGNGNVMEYLQLSHSLEELVELTNKFTSPPRLKIFAGYAGWAPGQLDDEMKRKSWLTHPADFNLIFSTDSKKLWKQILSGLGWQYKLLADGPEDLSQN
ncbi:MAG: YqgE/AlgH family protein [Pedosphaera sp.]|nr:YqgE/AlgH family protein [Pedosphaera sp.]MST01149.1 YqgE/AlgH family protein [Pedosphaera sp.]